jgi:cytochrome c556
VRRPFKILGCVMLFSVLMPGGARADDKDVIEYREHIMKTLNEQASAIGMILSGAAPDANLVEHIEIISLMADIALRSFEPKVQGGQAKPQVWTDWADFSKRMNEFARNATAVAKTAKEKGKDAATANILDALPCKSCHDIYRDDSKK